MNSEQLYKYLTEGRNVSDGQKKLIRNVANYAAGLSSAEEQDGRKKIGHVFGEGTSPRLRMLRSGLRAVGINDSAFLCHHSPRIVYSVDLARNTDRFSCLDSTIQPTTVLILATTAQ